MKQQAILCLLLQLFFELASCRHLWAIPGSSLVLTLLYIFIYCLIFIAKDGLELSISPVTAANEGKYECVMKEENMEMTRMYNITVEALIDYTIKVTKGSNIHLPCHFPPTSQGTPNALWFKEVDGGERILLDLEEDSTFDKKLLLLYPGDKDQTLLLTNTEMENAGIYHCESANGEKLSTVRITVEVATPVHHSCSNTTAWEPCQDENSRLWEPMLQESMTEFSMKLYSFLRESLPSSNLLFSPISISGALSHLLLGARGETRKSIETAVCVPHNFHCVHHQMKKLREKLVGSLQMASQIYCNPEMNLRNSFINQSIQFYEAEPTRLLETSEKNAQMINSWVANKTKNKITDLVDSVSPDTQLILLNAVSFNGQWKVKFDSKPKKGLFIKLDGDMVKVPLLYHQKYMMAMTYVVPLKAQVARLALTGDSSLYILLPLSSGVTDLQLVEEKMTDTAVLQMIEQMKTTTPQHVEVTLPQIRLDIQPNMNILLKKLGLSSLFEGANLCGLSEEKLVLNDARHRAFLALTEQGVEAGAVTTMSFSRSFPSFSALRPFIMLLWSDQANVPLFIGRVTDP
uniref:Serpin peptidase inhibitor, clade G (C1 inhibitor), member 1 n=1 Tax=Mastacembelus armatus TaxID=205130 RepID=A0A7N8X4P6_9TELE